MIRKDISTFLNTTNPRWPPYCSKYVTRFLKTTEKKRKWAVTISLLNLKCNFWQNPWSLELTEISNILLY